MKQKICILPEHRENIKKIMTNDTLDSNKRVDELSKFFNIDDAKIFNNMYEKSTLLKNQEVAIINYLDDISGISNEKRIRMKETFKKLYNERQSKIYNPDGTVNSNYLGLKNKTNVDLMFDAQELFNNKYDVSLTNEQAAKLISIKKKIELTSKLPLDANGNYSDEYGQAVLELKKYEESLKSVYEGKDALGVIKTLREQISNKTQGKNVLDKIYFGGKEIKDNLINSQTFKTMKATIDASFAAIQAPVYVMRTLLSTMFRGELKAGIKEVGNAFKVAFKSGGDKAYDATLVNLFKDKDYDKLVERGLRLVKREEMYGSNAPELIPGIGKVIKGANNWFSAFQQTARLGEAKRTLRYTEKTIDKLLGIKGYKIDLDNSSFKNLNKEQQNKLREYLGKGSFDSIFSDKTSTDIDVKLLDEIVDHANKITGTTNFGKYEKNAALLNEGFFAPRFMASDIKMYTDVFNPKASRIARLRSAESLGEGVAFAVGSYLTLAMIAPDNTEINPTSPNFMKIKIGDQWVGIKPKGKWLISLASKLILGYEKSGSGKKYKLGRDERKTKGDVILRTLRSKLAPLPSVGVDFFDGKDYIGNDATFWNELKNLAAPIAPTSMIPILFGDNDKEVIERIYTAFGQFFGADLY